MTFPTTSGTYNFAVTRDDIVNTAFEMAGIKGVGRVLSSDDITRGARLLNLIVKQWMGKSDFAPGLKVWSRERGILFPQYAQANYQIGPDGDNTTSAWYQSTITVAAAAGATSLTLGTVTLNSLTSNNPNAQQSSTVSALTTGWYIGVLQTDSSIFWTTISGAPTGSVVPLTAGLSVGAANGATVYVYSTKLPNPLQVLSIRRRNTSNYEVPLRSMDVHEYEDAVLAKKITGTPSRYLFEHGIADGLLFLDYQVSITTEIYILTYLREVQDFDNSTDNPDYPQGWYRPLVGQLAMDAATDYHLPVTQDMKEYRDNALLMAQNVDPDNEVVFFQPEA